MDTELALEEKLITVAALASAVKISRDKVRYYTRIGLLNPIRNESNGYKLYRESDKERTKFILKAKNLGYSLKDIELILNHAHHGHSPCPIVRDIIDARIEANRKKLDELNKLQARMELASEAWKSLPDKVPDGDSICHLIESFIHEN